MTDAFRCPECGYPTPGAEDLVEHMADAHDDDSFSLADVVDCRPDRSDDEDVRDIIV